MGWQLPAATGVAGIVLGVGIGYGIWRQEPLRESPTPSVAQADGKLTPENARKLIDAEYAARKGAECVWQGTRQETDKRWVYSPHDETDSRCVALLQAEGLASPGECLEKGCGGDGNCCSRVVTATGSAKLDKEQNGLVIPCGVFEILGVTSVTTDGNKASVKFERIFKEDATLTAKLEACKMEKPAADKAELPRTYVRDDAGNWALVGR